MSAFKVLFAQEYSLPRLDQPCMQLISDFFKQPPEEKSVSQQRLPCVEPRCQQNFATPAARAIHVKRKHPTYHLPLPKDLNPKNKRYRHTYARKKQALQLLADGMILLARNFLGKTVAEVARVFGVHHSLISRWSTRAASLKIQRLASQPETSKRKSEGSGRTAEFPQVT